MVAALGGLEIREGDAGAADLGPIDRSLPARDIDPVDSIGRGSPSVPGVWIEVPEDRKWDRDGPRVGGDGLGRVGGRGRRIIPEIGRRAGHGQQKRDNAEDPCCCKPHPASSWVMVVRYPFHSQGQDYPHLRSSNPTPESRREAVGLVAREYVETLLICFSISISAKKAAPMADDQQAVHQRHGLGAQHGLQGRQVGDGELRGGDGDDHGPDHAGPRTQPRSARCRGCCG
jgi:hypothetical protein